MLLDLFHIGESIQANCYHLEEKHEQHTIRIIINEFLVNDTIVIQI
jgi:hypothetical protein